MRSETIAFELERSRDKLMRIAERRGKLDCTSLLTSVRSEMDTLCCLRDEVPDHIIEDVDYLIGRFDALVASLVN